jgi:hypothetical protein
MKRFEGMFKRRPTNDEIRRAIAHANT